MRLAILVALTFVMPASPWRAEPAAAENCDSAKSSAEIVECLSTETAVWHRRLKVAYQKLLETPAGAPARPAPQRAAVVAAIP